MAPLFSADEIFPVDSTGTAEVERVVLEALKYTACLSGNIRKLGG